MAYNYDRTASSRDDEQTKNEKLQSPMAGTLEMLLRGLNLSGPSMKAVQKLRQDLLKGKAKARDVKEIKEDLSFDIKNEVGGKRNLKKIKDLEEVLGRMHSKLNSKTAATIDHDVMKREAIKAWQAGAKAEGGSDVHPDQVAYNKAELKDAVSEVQRALKGVANGKKGDIQNLTANVWQLCYFAGAVHG